MASRYDHDAFVNIMSPLHVQPTMLLCSLADMNQSDWYVLSVATRVSDRWVRVEMENGGRVVVSHVAPDDIVHRKVYRSAI